MRKIRNILYYSIYLISFLLLVDYLFYRAYLLRINNASYYFPERDSFPAIQHVDAAAMSRLGWVSIKKKSCFINFDEKKRQNIIRVGCFGGSYTQGDEVNEIYDYPSLLQRIFANSGYNNFEVINFGSAWFGFSQAFMMWEYIGSKYELDYVLLDPRTLNSTEKETTFNHTINTGALNIDYMHARFILRNKKLQLIDVYGDTIKNRANNYLRFIPPFRYLRFDTNSPPFLACLIPRGRQLMRNPFYYYCGEVNDEVKEIHKLLLSEMIKDSRLIILGSYSKEKIDLTCNFKKENFLVAPLYDRSKFPYSMLHSHHSPCGNQLLAQQMFDVIVGKRTSRLNILETGDREENSPVENSLEKCKLSEYKDMKIEINDITMGCFMNTYRDFFSKSEQFDITGSRIVALLAIKRKSESILDAVFVPLDFSLTENPYLKISVSSDNGKKGHVIGDVRLLNSALEIGVVELEDMRHDNKNSIEYSGSAELLKKQMFLGKHPRIAMLLNGRIILKATSVNYQKGSINFKPVHHNLIVIKPEEDSFLDIDKLDEDGNIYLSLYCHDGKKIKVPFARWIKEQKAVLLY